MDRTLAVFYAGGEMMVVDVSVETEQVAYDMACRQGSIVVKICRDAYLWARRAGNPELTESLLLQYMKENGE
ncbi:MAG: hypothetical protein HQ536_04815 [Parcubacteria group bacterium]|nr:hypothetical protein [Parcubacteria group bacterium]